MKRLTTVLAIVGAMTLTSTAWAQFSQTDQADTWFPSPNIEARMKCGGNCEGNPAADWEVAWFQNPGTVIEDRDLIFSSGTPLNFSITYEPSTSTYTFTVNGESVDYVVSDTEENMAHCEVGIQLKARTDTTGNDNLTQSSAAINGLAINGTAQDPSYSAASDGNQLRSWTFASNDPTEAVTDVTGTGVLTWLGNGNPDTVTASILFPNDEGDVCEYVEPEALAVPTIREWGKISLALLALLIGGFYLRRRVAA